MCQNHNPVLIVDCSHHRPSAAPITKEKGEEQAGQEEAEEAQGEESFLAQAKAQSEAAASDLPATLCALPDLVVG